MAIGLTYKRGRKIIRTKGGRGIGKKGISER
jgi:hypothetical protein